MGMYTIIDINDIFYDPNSVSNGDCCKDIGNIHFEGVHFKNGIKIHRIISTNPNDYLDNKYSIGKFIK